MGDSFHVVRVVADDGLLVDDVLLKQLQLGLVVCALCFLYETSHSGNCVGLDQSGVLLLLLHRDQDLGGRVRAHDVLIVLEQVLHVVLQVFDESLAALLALREVILY